MGNVKFGTDGWRAIIAEDFTFKNVERVAQATAAYWKKIEPGKNKAVVGYDRRFLSGEFAAATAEVLAANGFQVTLTTQPVPTPAVSYAVKAQGAAGGVMITASHNPPAFNGFKLKASYGGSAESTICAGVEGLLDKSTAGKSQGSITKSDITTDYFAAIKKLVNFPLIAKSGLKFAHEALYGVGAGCFDRLLKGTSCTVTTLNGEHDPNFGGINPEPIAKNYGKSAAYLKKHPHDLCLVTDGDADRVGGMTGRGEYLSTHEIICLLVMHLIKNRRLKGRVIKALTTTSMLDKICAEQGVELVETGVGFKYIAAEMIKGNYLLGCEESGGLGFPGHIPERDGILAGLMLLEMLAMEKRPLPKLLAELSKKYGPHYYDRIDTHFPLEKRAALMDYCKNNPPKKLGGSSVCDIKSFDGVKFVAEDGSWLMLRGSGTEPILRIYAETSSPEGAQKLLKEGVKLTSRV